MEDEENIKILAVEILPIKNKVTKHIPCGSVPTTKRIRNSAFK